MTGPLTGPMTCDELAPLARDASRALSLPDSGGGAPAAVALDDERLQRVRDHLARCRSCAELLDQERRLDARLAALAAAGEPPGPPPELEEQLTRTFRARLARPDVFDLSLRTPIRTGGTSPCSSRRRSAPIARAGCPGWSPGA